MAAEEIDTVHRMSDTANMSCAQGIQLGDGNTQNNFFRGAGPVDPEVLLRHVRELAPGHLEGRDAELAELTAFCRSDEPYVRWEAEPWAGKTALLATLVVRPPDGVDVLHFFVRAGESDWNDSRALAASLHAQLVAYLGARMSGTDDPGLFQSEIMLDRAAEQADAAGRRLVLIVDGIDEDQIRNRTPVLPSIVSLLPAVPHRALGCHPGRPYAARPGHGPDRRGPSRADWPGAEARRVGPRRLDQTDGPARIRRHDAQRGAGR